MKIPNQRHFPYQHPVFGTEKRPKRSSYWENTVYFLWWSYLRRNDAYRETCQERGAGDLAALYKDFGDVHAQDFKSWWTDEGRGAKLFAQPQVVSTLQVVAADEVGTLEQDLIFISVPLNLPKKFLLERFRKVLAEHHTGRVGKQYAKKSDATYKFRGQLNFHALKTALDVFDHVLANPKKKLWEVGKILPQFQMELSDCEKKGEVPSYAFKRTIEATVSRYKRKAAQSIKNVGMGVFP